jgi:hypothetical protein
VVDSAFRQVVETHGVGQDDPDRHGDQKDGELSGHMSTATDEPEHHARCSDGNTDADQVCQQ